MTSQNQLAAWLQMFDRENRAPRSLGANPAYVSQLGSVPVQEENGARRMMWAQNMMMHDQRAPDFFSDSQPQPSSQSMQGPDANPYSDRVAQLLRQRGQSYPAPWQPNLDARKQPPSNALLQYWR